MPGGGNQVRAADILAGPCLREVTDIGGGAPVVISEPLRIVPPTLILNGSPVRFARHLPRPAPFHDARDQQADGQGVVVHADDLAREA